ncbi:LPXTG cell wall anchor domain-containing protein [Lacticaseibacillus sharpeae]|uniref:LPXTG cell wall anchor domain-containing protein n=1 Tax=Lacticaseibacillus sharpeae TaxID=1626 RepID=UPI00138F1A35|nr:LPXTG cell wall anchor domain-containing protein [Lacticaseibacillus sharpeae]
MIIKSAYKIDPKINNIDGLKVPVATEDENGNAGDGYTVTDTPEGILPHTGGAGIIAIVVAGLAIVTVGVIAYNRRRANA